MRIPEKIDLPNPAGEVLTISLVRERYQVGRRGAVERNRLRLTIVSASEPVVWLATERAVYADGVPLNHWSSSEDGQTLELTSGDWKRRNTYPLYLVRAGQPVTRRSRFRVDL